MDTKMEIKEEDPLSDWSQNTAELLPRNVVMKKNSSAVFPNNNCDSAMKAIIKSEPHFPGFYLQASREMFSNPVIKEAKFETVTGRSCKIETKREIVEQTLVSDFGLQNDREFFLEDSVMKVKKCSSDHEMDNKVEIKEERWWLDTETSSVPEDIKDEEFAPVESPRLCTDSSNVSPLPSAENSGKVTSLYNEKDCPRCETEEPDMTKTSLVEKHLYTGQFVDCSVGKIDSSALYMKQNNLIHKGTGLYKCNICERNFINMSHLKRHKLIHGGERPHKCNICDKRFIQLSHLKSHNLIHGGKKPYRCEICKKEFIHLSSLKSHSLLHEGKQPHKCEICDKRFNRLSDLKSHNFVHEGEKPYKCKICEQGFTYLSSLKLHNLLHEGKKPHKCEVCNKRFTRLSDLKLHNLIHEGKKPHKCEICKKSFTQLPHLKSHNLLHEGKKPHKCEICDEVFTRLSSVKRHNLIHEGKKPYRCAVCEKGFTRLSTLKRHSLIHQCHDATKVGNF